MLNTTAWDSWRNFSIQDHNGTDTLKFQNIFYVILWKTRCYLFLSQFWIITKIKSINHEPMTTQLAGEHIAVFVMAVIYLGYFLQLCTVLTPFHSTLILTSSPPSGPLSYFTTSTLRLSLLRLFSVLSGSLSTSATLCLWTLSRPWQLDKTE